MKTFFALFIVLLFVTTTTFAQDANENDQKDLWETNIQAILSGDVETVVSQSYFPMTTFEGEWDKAYFLEAYDIIFDASVLAQLSELSYEDIQLVENETEDPSYMIVIATATEIDGELYESATILSFKKFDGAWKLYAIDMAG